MLNCLRVVNQPNRRIQWLQFGWAIFGLVLFWVTPNLWHEKVIHFPQIPLIPIGCRIPRDVDLLSMVGIFASLVVTAGYTKLRQALSRSTLVSRIAMSGFCGLTALMIVADQHRLQPWVYLAFLTGLVLISCRSNHAVYLLRLLVISVYIHSALSKLDHAFLASTGQAFLAQVKLTVGLNAQPSPGDWMAASVFPMSELLIALGLCHRRYRRTAVIAAVVMHVVLIWILGPFGLNQEKAVVVWNAYFVWQLFTLFGQSKIISSGNRDGVAPDVTSAGTPTVERTWAESGATVVIAIAVLLPLLEPIGYFDHWLSWGLYAPRNSRCRLFVDDEAVSILESADWSCEADVGFEPDFGWTPGRQVRMSHESLRRLDVPIYPQDRFQLGAALAIIQRYELGDSAHVILESASNRITGVRNRETFHGLSQIEKAAGRFWWNVEPRDSF